MNKGIDVILRDGGLYTISQEQIDYWKIVYPELDIEDEIGYLKEMWNIGAMPRRTAKNITKHINKYLYQVNKDLEAQTTIDDYL